MHPPSEYPQDVHLNGEVIRNNKFQGYRSFLPNIQELLNASCGRKSMTRQRCNCIPKITQSNPAIHFLIVLYFNPAALIIGRKIPCHIFRTAHDALMIVRSRIDQVPRISFFDHESGVPFLPAKSGDISNNWASRSNHFIDLFGDGVHTDFLSNRSYESQATHHLIFSATVFAATLAEGKKKIKQEAGFWFPPQKTYYVAETRLCDHPPKKKKCY